MSLFLRFLLPATYFEATRVPTFALKVYNGLVEWLPALAFGLYFNEFRPGAVVIVLLSYAAFISVYEIGYLTNDLLSERFEDDPRGRAARFAGREWVVYALISARIFFFLLCTFLLGVTDSGLWWAFHASLLAVFAMHNTLPNEMRIATFFGLSAYRFLGPLVVALAPQTLAVLIPAVLLNHSLYRTTVYLRGKFGTANVAESVPAKIGFYAGCLPLALLLSYLYGSWIPAGLCVYFGFVWVFYWTASQATGWKPGPG